jgi:uncharacterized protein YbjQ (UPF0145 family)
MTRDEQSLAAIEAGGIPIAAQERLDALRSGGGGFFTSDLSVNEFLLLRQAGFEPITQVMGSSVYQVGWQQTPWASTGWYTNAGTVELDSLTGAWNDARSRALARLGEEATRAGADAVAGVRMTRGNFAESSGLIEFATFGTAMRSTRYEIENAPVLTNLSGQDFAKLYSHGYWPVGLVAATSVTYVVSSWQTQNAMRGFRASLQNQELTDFTQGLYEARQHALLRLTRQAHEAGGQGIVGVQIEQHQAEHEVEQNGKRTDLIVTLHAVGTAIVELRRTEETPTYYALALEDNG